MAAGQAKVVFKIEGIKDAINSLESAKKALAQLQKSGVAVSNKLDGEDFGEEQIVQLRKELDKAGVAYKEVAEDIQEVQGALEGLSSEAELSLNSLAGLEAKAAELSESLGGLEIGSAAFKKTKQELEQINKRLETASLSAEESQLVFAELGSKVAATFTIGAGLAASFAAENEDVQQALLIVQQAVAAVELIKNATETAQLARKAEQIEQEEALQRELQATAKAQLEVNDAQNKGAETTGKLKSATGTFAGVMKGLFIVLKTNPLLALAGIIGSVAFAIVALSGKFKPFANIVEFVLDSLGGLKQVFKDVSSGAINLGDVFKALGSTVTDTVAVVTGAVTGVFKSLFGDAETAFDDLNKATAKFGQEAGEVFGKSFAAGVSRTQKLRQNELDTALNDLSDGFAAIEEARTASGRAGENARSGIRLRELEEDKKLAEEKLQLAANLSDAELNILKSGNVDKIKELRKVVDERGRIDAEVLENLKAFEDKQTALIVEQEQARLTAIADRISSIDATLAVEQARLANVENFVNKASDIEARYTAEVQKLALRRQAGEFKSLKEVQTERARIDQERLNEATVLNKERLSFERELERQKGEIQSAELERQLEEGARLRTLDFEEQIGLINRVRDFRSKALDAEEAQLDLRATEGIQRAAEIEAERAALAIETNDRVRATAVSTADAIAAAGQAQIAIATQLLALAQARADIDNQEAQAALNSSNASLERAKLLTTNLKNATSDYLSTLDQITAQQEENEARIQARLQLDNQALVLQVEALDVDMQRITALKEAGEIGEAQFKDELARFKVQKQALLELQSNNVIRANIEIQLNEAQAEAQAEDALKGYSAFIGGYLQGPVAAEVAQAINNTFGVLGPLINDLTGQVANQLLELVATVQAAQLARIDLQIEATTQRVTEAEALLAEIEAEADESSTRIQELTAQALASTGEQQSAILAQLSTERAARDSLAKAQKQQASEARKLVQQQIELEKKRADLEKKQRQQQKAFQIASAIANTAIGITRIIAEVPKADFGIATGILIALYAALGAAQVATVAAQPARDGGYLVKGGDLVQMRDGGLIQGPSHEAGGVRGTGSFAGIEVEGGEAIIPKAAVLNNRDMVAALIRQGPTQKLRDGTLDLMPSSPAMQAAAVEAQGSPQVQGLQDSINALAARKNVVSVVDIAEAQGRVAAIDASSSI